MSNSPKSDPAAVRFGLTVRAHRKRLKMSLDALAARVGMDKADLSRLENGRSERGPSLERIEVIAAALGIAPSRLVKSIDPKPAV